MSRNNYSRGCKCSGCGVPVTNHARKCCSCNARSVGANYRGLPGKRRKYQEILAEMAAQPAQNEPDVRQAMARMEFSPWQTLPDGTLMRTVTGI
jgi:hypothetical protein